MKKISLFAYVMVLATISASAREVVLVAHNQRSASGTLSTLVWKDCGAGGATGAPCLDPNNPWIVTNGIVGSTVTWDWDPINTVLTGTGLYSTSIYISSNPSGSSILADRVVNLQIDLTFETTSGTSYDCVEGTFVATVGANACGSYNLGPNFANDSTVAYNVGGDPYCIIRTLGGDDSSTGTPRGPAEAFTLSCTETHSAFPLYSLVQDNLDTGGTLIISNGICLGAPGQGTSPQIYAPCANANFMTFRAVAEPQAVADTANTPLNTPVTINVLANDTDFDSPVTVTISAAPLNGSAVVNGSPGDPATVNVTYTPNAGFRGSDTFQYAVTDGAASDTATVTVSVGLTPQYYPAGPQANVPLATITGGGWTQCYAAPMGTPIGNSAENVLSVCNGNNLMMAGRQTGSNTFLILAAAPFAETISNTGGGSNTHLVNGSNWYFTPSWSWGFTTANDTVDLNSCDVGGSSPASMCLHTSDGGGFRINDILWLNDSTEYEKVFFVNSVPGAYDDSATTYLSKPINVTVLANDVGFGNPVTVTVSTAPLNGTAVVNGSPGNSALIYVTYAPAPGFQGTDTFQYLVDDGTMTGIATVTVTVDAPQANQDVTETRLATPVAIDVLANDVGFSDPVTVTVTTNPLNGTAVVTGSPGNAAGLRINYTPAAGFTGSDSLQYQVTDGVNSASATVSITVAAFWAIADEYNVLSFDSPALFVAANDIGFSDPVTLTIIDFPAQGSAHTHNSPGSQSNVYIHYNASNGNYTDTMTYELSDGVHTDRATVTVHVVQYAAQDDEVLTGGGIPVTIDIVQNDFGFNYPRTVGIYTNPGHGSAVVNNPTVNNCCDNPTITYTSNPGFFGDDTFQYAIDDGTQIDIATVTVHVINDADNDQVDDNSDNCVGFANANQRDVDGDGYGSMCDADFNNDGRVNFADLAVFRSKFTTADANVDMDGSGLVNFADLARLRAQFGKPPGPSAIAP